MVKWMIISCLIFLHILVHAQKPELKVEDFRHWDELQDLSFGESCLASSNGRYIFYRELLNGEEILVLKRLSDLKEYKYVNVLQFKFSANGEFAFILKSDSIFNIIHLDSEKVKSFSYVHEFSYDDSMPEYLFLSIAEKHSLQILDFTRDTSMFYPNVSEYRINSKLKSIILNCDSSIKLLSITSHKLETVANGVRFSDIDISRSGKWITYYSERRKVYLYRYGWNNAKMIFDLDSTTKINQGYRCTNKWFTINEESVLIKLSGGVSKSIKSGAVLTHHVDIWTYHDKYYQSEQLLNPALNDSDLFYSINLSKDLTSKELISSNGVILSFPNIYPGRFLLSYESNTRDFWSHDSCYIRLTSIKTGETFIVYSGIGDRVRQLEFSPDYRFLLWFDNREKKIYSYEIKTRKINVLENAMSTFFDYTSDMEGRKLPFGVFCWLLKDDAVLLYDNFDIWKWKVNSLHPPVCVTNFYGRKHKMILRAVSGQEMDANKLDTLLLCAWDTVTKNNGFFKLPMSKVGDPKLCSIGPYVYHFPQIKPSLLTIPSIFRPIKVGNKKSFIVRRMDCTSSANLYLTADFVSFKRITDIRPEDKYNWMTSRLVKWEISKGDSGIGVLYQPENFNPSRRYPVIFHYYEKRSDELNFYRIPQLSNGVLDIPWFVSNGYLVFIPDISYKTGEPEEGIKSTLISAAMYFRRQSFVDSSRIGLQGHSFGGYETNFIITQTDVFKAAQSSAGTCDLISAYGGINGIGISRQILYETNQGNLGIPPWRNFKAYYNASPIFFIDSIRTPLLIMHNKGDAAVPFSQATEFYSAFRRAGKPCWLLQYDGEGHTIADVNNALDFTYRLHQFFDHYLKGKEMPDWMRMGVTAKEKGINSGF
ncbi:alpha/beta hydrolase family protein [Chitinophaga ginsengisoli]|uniref:Prolyl oligopeptidase family protein n=1 Tax=Chitinophaga ginsengisoli TaxID=363837 RepID=A0A2P8G9Y7_9BACT|nr:prolyl oligopeptidase family serine peptidase [Chitinophaga ginsengisoli]PSL30705.1 prolyl oligopeptidase family protein [Chitinophaga ginsengisoli]